MKTKNTDLVILNWGGELFVFIAPMNEPCLKVRWEDYSETHGGLAPGKAVIDCFVGYLVNVLGYARQDIGCDYDMLELSSFPLD